MGTQTPGAHGSSRHAPYFCSCGKCHHYCQFHDKADDSWVPCCFSWFIGLHKCPDIIEAELILEPRCRLQPDGQSAWFAMFVTKMKLKNNSERNKQFRNWDSVNFDFDTSLFDVHCTIGTFLVKPSQFNKWDQKMLQIARSHGRCQCHIEGIIDEQPVDWHKQWWMTTGGNFANDALNTMRQSFSLKLDGPPVEGTRSLRPWERGLFFHISAWNRKPSYASSAIAHCLESNV